MINFKEYYNNKNIESIATKLIENNINVDKFCKYIWDNKEQILKEGYSQIDGNYQQNPDNYQQVKVSKAYKRKIAQEAMYALTLLKTDLNALGEADPTFINLGDTLFDRIQGKNLQQQIHDRFMKD